MTQTQEQAVPTGDTPFVPIEKIVSLCKRRFRYDHLPEENVRQNR